MKNISLFIHLLISIYANAQSELIQFGSKSFDGINAIQINNQGDIYTTGYFQGNLEKEGLTSNGNTDAFISKYSYNGKLLWITNIGSNYKNLQEITEFGKTLVLDNEENVYTIGLFYGKIELKNDVIKAEGKQDIFISKHDKDGNMLWINSVGNVGNESITNLLIDKTNNLYLVGKSSEKTLTNSKNNESAFISKFNSSGNLLWSKKINPQQQSNFSVKKTFLSLDKIYLLTKYEEEDNKKNNDILIYDFDGIIIESKNIVSTPNTKAIDFNVNSKKEVLILNVSEIKVKNKSIYHVIKYNRNGDIIWNREYKNSIDFKPTQLVIQDDNFLVIGEFFGNLHFNNVIFNGFSDILIFNHYNNGDIKGIDAHTGYGQNKMNQILIKKDRIYLVGQFFDELKINNKILKSYGKSDAFILVNKFDNEIVNNTDYLIYPNPNNGEFFIKTTTEVDKVEIFDLLGRLIFRKTIENKGEIKIPNIQNAVYNLVLYKKNTKLYTTKIIINK